MSLASDLKLIASIVRLLDAVYGWFQHQKWYQEGKAAAYAEINAEQEKRIAQANAARADADAIDNLDRLRDLRD